MMESEKIKVMGMPLTALQVDGKARILRIITDEAKEMQKLAAFGIMPGVDVVMIQKYPAYVLQVGFTQVALDSAIASKIFVSNL